MMMFFYQVAEKEEIKTIIIYFRSGALVQLRSHLNHSDMVLLKVISFHHNIPMESYNISFLTIEYYLYRCHRYQIHEYVLYYHRLSS